MFVLVHGAGHGGWCYGRVAPRLRAAGHDVFTPTLTGLGERVHLRTDEVDLELHIADVVNLLRFERLEDVTLVGHSYGGPVITGVGDREPERISRLVYLDAAYLRNGQSVADAIGLSIENLRAGARTVDGVDVILAPDEDGGPFYGVEDAEDRAWMAGRLVAQPWRCFAQPLHLVDEARVAAIPTFHVVCTKGASNLDPETAAAARAEGRCWSIDTGHELMITEPEEVARILLDIVER